MSAYFGNVFTISERVNDSTQNYLSEKTPPAKTLTTSLPPIENLYPILESVSSQTDNTLIAPNIPEQNNAPVMIDTPHPCTLKEDIFQR